VRLNKKGEAMDDFKWFLLNVSTFAFALLMMFAFACGLGVLLGFVFWLLFG